MTHGQSTWNSQGTCSMVRATSPEDGRSILHPPWSRGSRGKCAKSHLEPPSMHYPCKCGGAELIGPLSQPPLNNDPWPICSKLTGDLQHSGDNIPWRWQVHTLIPLEAALPGVNVSNHIWSCQPCTALYSPCDSIPSLYIRGGFLKNLVQGWLKNNIRADWTIGH